MDAGATTGARVIPLFSEKSGAYPVEIGDHLRLVPFAIQNAFCGLHLVDARIYRLWKKISGTIGGLIHVENYYDGHFYR